MKQILRLSGEVIVKSDEEDITIRELAEKNYNNLFYAELSGADLSNADLTLANLFSANLSGANLFSTNLFGADLSGVDLSGADLSNANLYYTNFSYANLSGIKNYCHSHSIFTELCRHQKIETFTEKEWVAIGQISLHLPCWGAIKKRFGKTALSIAKKLAEAGWDEYYREYQEVLGNERELF